MERLCYTRRIDEFKLVIFQRDSLRRVCKLQLTSEFFLEGLYIKGKVEVLVCCGCQAYHSFCSDEPVFYTHDGKNLGGEDGRISVIESASPEW